MMDGSREPWFIPGLSVRLWPNDALAWEFLLYLINFCTLILCQRVLYCKDNNQDTLLYFIGVCHAKTSVFASIFYRYVCI